MLFQPLWLTIELEVGGQFAMPCDQVACTTDFGKIEPLERKGGTMKRAILTCLFGMTLTISAMAQQSGTQAASAADWKAVDSAMGRAGQEQPDGTHKFSMPRSDLKVTVAGVQVKAGLALGSWAAFHKMGDEAEVMGDLVLTEDEVPEVMQKLISSGIEITALHNHLLDESPRVMYMHIHGKGPSATLAGYLRDALSATKTPPAAPAPSGAAPDLSFETNQIDSIAVP